MGPGGVNPTARAERERRGWVVYEKVGAKIGVDLSGRLE